MTSTGLTYAAVVATLHAIARENLLRKRVMLY